MAIKANHMLFDIIPTLPVSVNYLAGPGPHQLEAGAGITLGAEAFGHKYSENRRKAFFVPTLGYRYQPLDDGLSFRLVFAPLVSDYVRYGGGLVLAINFEKQP